MLAGRRLVYFLQSWYYKHCAFTVTVRLTLVLFSRFSTKNSIFPWGTELMDFREPFRGVFCHFHVHLHWRYYQSRKVDWKGSEGSKIL